MEEKRHTILGLQNKLLAAIDTVPSERIDQERNEGQINVQQKEENCNEQTLNLESDIAGDPLLPCWRPCRSKGSPAICISAASRPS